MAKDAIVSEELAKKFSTEKDTPYLRWVRAEGLALISAHYVRNLRPVELKPWARRGGSGVFINHEASRTSNDCYVCEVPPGKQLEPQRQLFEEMISRLKRRLRLGGPGGQTARAAAPAVRRDDLRAQGPRIELGVERRRPEGELR